ncbi:MAG TPA: CPBP family intramembrane glutamic endopeptidase [Cytophagaceae bacterium]
MDNYNSENNPFGLKILKGFGVLLVYTGLLIIGVALATLIAQAVVGTSSADALKLLELSKISDDQQRQLLLTQAISATFTFIVFPLTYLLLLKKDLLPELITNWKNIVVFLALSILLIFTLMPVVAYVVEWNKSLHLPEALSTLEQWMLEKETQMEKLTQFLIPYDTTSEFILVFLVIAIIPAIGEEFLFRGLLQNELHRALGNPHIAIFLTGFLFSFIHFQFFGFFPRMMLGVLFGYLYYWSGNLLIPIIVHLINNGFTLILMNMRNKKQLDFDIESTQSIPLGSMLFALAVGSLLIYYYRNISLRSGILNRDKANESPNKRNEL